MSAPARGPELLRLCLSGPSLPSQLADARYRLATWARNIGVERETVEDLVLAAHEALANVADHAYPEPDSGGEALLDAEVSSSGEIVVVVRDHGRWRVPSADPGWRGRGMVIIRALADAVVVRRDEGGTTVEMRWRLPSGPEGRNQHVRRREG